jgi:A/G-specific adenine glycosylase
MPPRPPTFADRLLAWWAVHGRHDLPWQHPRDPYRVWVSEIMLQQTRVETVVGYFQRFMARFPDVATLADSALDDVLAQWSGLGYYARARNLHRAAVRIRDHHGGVFPADAEALAKLPGIGRSTAAAIVGQAFDRRAVILDGNVKRVLARHAGVPGWPGRSAVERRLWEEAEARTPPARAADYTQAIMDLGATLCMPKGPACLLCPVSDDCRARIEGRQVELPEARPSKTPPERSAGFLLLRDDAHRVLLQRRPGTGIWGGLWCLPEAGTDSDRAFSESFEALQAPAPIRHVFSHFALTMHFDHRRIGAASKSVRDVDDLGWFSLAEALELGIPKPVRTVLSSLCSVEARCSVVGSVD